MRKISVVLCAVTVLLAINPMHATAQNIYILQSTATPGLDTEWQNVVTGLGYTAISLTYSNLATAIWHTGDALIITDPNIAYTAFDYIHINDGMVAGVSIYVQCNEDPGSDLNLIFEALTVTTGATFSWVGSIMGTLDAKVMGPVAAQFNDRVPQLTMYDACKGDNSGAYDGVVQSICFGPFKVGFLYHDPAYPGYGLVATNTDHEWILPYGPDVDLMENYIEILLANTELSHFARFISPVGFTTIPATGGTITYDLKLGNAGTGGVFPTTVWVRTFVPSGSVLSWYSLGPTTITLPAGTVVGPITRNIPVPPWAPPGAYFVQAMMADTYPGFTIVYDTDSFKVVKLP